MTSKRAGLSIALLIIATTLWGASSAVLAKIGRADGTGAPLLAAGGATTLVLVVLTGPARGQVRKIMSMPRYSVSLVLIGLLEAVNLGLYASALALGPVPVVVPLHLTSPLLLVALSVLRRQRHADALIFFQTLLMVSGIALLGMQPLGQPGREPLVAGVLALGSAVAVAWLIAAVAKLARTVNPDVASAAQLAVAAVATAPVTLVAAPPDQVDAAILLAAGALFLGPGFAIYWRALRGLTAATASIVGLNEAVAATVLGFILFDETISLVSVLSGVLVLTAILLEVLRNKIRSRTGITHFSNESE